MLQRVGAMGRRMAILLVLVLGSSRTIEAQVGLASGAAQVALVARVAPGGSIQAVGPVRDSGREGSIRESSAVVRFSSNTGYSLVVRSTGASTSRIWVRAVSGEFQELTPGSAITVGRGSQSKGQWEREVSYHTDGGEQNEGSLGELPVRYEIAITPTL